jgi:broad specificity phosphatase PhoE
MPHVAEGTPASEWHLDAESRRAADAAADGLELDSGVGVVVTSTEPKAVETAAAVSRRWSVRVEHDDRLREVVRPWIGAGYRAMAHRYLRGEVLDGWEPHAEVAERVAAAVDDAVARAAEAATVVVTHGLALSLHLGHELGADFDRESFWSRLAFPDSWVLDPDGVLHRSRPRSAIS